MNQKLKCLVKSEIPGDDCDDDEVKSMVFMMILKIKKNSTNEEEPTAENDCLNNAKVNHEQYQRIKAERRKLEANYESEMQNLVQRQAEYTKDIIKRDQEYEQMRNHSSSKLMERAKFKNRVERQKHQEVLETIKNQTAFIKSDYEKKLKAFQEEYEKILDNLE